jgi:hypothetical protein
MSDESQQAVTPAETTTIEPAAIEAPVTQADKPADKPAEAATDKPADEGETERRKPSGSERLKRQKERLAAELAAERAKREDLERRFGGNEQHDPKPGVDREPKEDDFPNDYFAYQRAQNAWEVRQAVRAERERDDQIRQRAKAQESQLELADEYADHAETARERIPDFDDVVSKVSHIGISPELAEEIFSAGSKGPLISYYLAQHPEKLRELQSMNGKALAREVGRIAERVHLPQSKKATEASPPPNIPKGGAVPAFDPFKTDDMSAYVKWRQGGGGKRASS